VRLKKDGKIVAELATDNYGDFKFDRLAPDSGAYTVEIEAAGLKPKTLDVTLARSVYLGEIRL
jgi:hypothetical protein